MRGEGLRDVAERIGVDATTLMQYRSGRRRLSMESFAGILAAYGDAPVVRDAALHYARVEYHPPAPDSLDAAAAALPDATAETLRAYVERLPEEAVTTGRGLYVCSTDARALSFAVQFLLRACERARIATCHLRADRPVTAADRRRALASPVLVVDRIDFARDAVEDLLRERANLVRPLIVTSMQPPDAVTDAHLRRVFASLTRLHTIDPDPTSLPTSHAELPAESVQR